MKKFLFLISITTCCIIFGGWHSWKNPPSHNQLYMVVHLIPGLKPEFRQVLMIKTYNSRISICKKEPLYQHKENGWWDVTKEDLWQWLHEGSRMIYCP